MSRIIEQIEQIGISDNDAFIMDNSSNGCHQISGADLKLEIMNSFDPKVAPHSAGFHNSLYRGKNLGTKITSDQKTVIDNGLFTGMFVGDYWTLNGRVYRIADFDTFYRCGDNGSLDHHITLVPDERLFGYQMCWTESGGYEASGNTSYGGYIGCYFHTGIPYGQSTKVVDQTGYEQMNSTVQADLTASQSVVSILSYRDWIPGSATMAVGVDSTASWQDCAVELMSETMVYGEPVWASTGYSVGCCARQLSLFRLNPSMIHNRQDWWLRNATGSAYFARVDYRGPADSRSASYALGVRPLLLVR
jgi:hypothetical protein